MRSNSNVGNNRVGKKIRKFVECFVALLFDDFARQGRRVYFTQTYLERAILGRFLHRCRRSARHRVVSRGE